MDNNVRTAVVTGASSGIGLAIAKELVALGYEVYGIGRNFDKCTYVNQNFHKIVCDLSDAGRVLEEIKKIDAKKDTEVLVNNAGVGYYGLCEEIKPERICEMIRVNLEAPMLLTSTLMRTLKKNKGWVINISSVTAENSNPHGCVYGATKAGLSSFSRSVFDEARKYGVKVVSILPDMTDTQLYRNADFEADSDIMAHIEPEEIAEAVRYILSQREGTVVTSLTIKPQLHRIHKKDKT
jgi:short-subunit dehydrogenase